MWGGTDTENGPNGISVVRRAFYIWVDNGNAVGMDQSGTKEKSQWVLARDRVRPDAGEGGGVREKTYEGMPVDRGAMWDILAVGHIWRGDAVGSGHETVGIDCDAESGRKAVRGERGGIPKDMRQ